MMYMIMILMMVIYFWVVNSYMKIGDEFGGDRMYKKRWCLCW